MNYAYESLADALRQDLLKARSKAESDATMEHMGNKNISDWDSEAWNELYWKAPSYIHHWTKICTDLYSDAGYGSIVDEILSLKDRKANWKSALDSK